MQKKAWFIGSFAASMLLAAWWVAARNPGSPDPGHPDAASSSGPSRVARNELDRLDGDEVSSSRAEVADFETSPTHGLEVSVLDGESGEPAGGAELLYVERCAVTDRELHDMWGTLTGMSSIPAHYGRRFRAGERGRAIVPASSGSVLITARLDEAWGHAVFYPGDATPVEVRLAGDSTLRVRVVDSSGSICPGVPVELHYTRDNDLRYAGRFVTDARDGIATIRHVSALLGGAEGAQVHVDRPLGEPVQETIDPSDLPEGIVELTLPPTGRVRLLVDTPAEEGQRSEYHVELRAFAAETSERHRATDRLRGEGSGITKDGEFLFEHVGLDTDLEVVAQISVAGKRVIGSTFARLAGPTAAGELITFHLEGPRQPPVVRFTVRDSRDGVLANTNLMVHSWRERGGGTAPLRTDAHGLLRFALTDRARGVVPIAHCAVWQRSPGVAEVVFFPVPQDLPSGDHDLGELRFGDAPPFVEGRVVDGRGRAIAGAVVSVVPLDQPIPWPDFGRGWPRSVSTQSDESGEFRIHAPPAEGEFWIHAYKSGFAPTPRTPFRAGSSGLSLVVHGDGRVAARVRLPDGVDASLLEAELQLVPSDGGDVTSHRCVPDRFGNLSWMGLATGVASIAIRANAEPEPLVVIGGIPVRPGVAPEDQRLPGIELEDGLSRTVLHVRDANGDAVSSFWVSYKPAGGTEYAGPLSGTGGSATLLSLSTELDVRVEALELRPAIRERVSGEVEIAMRRELAVRVQLVPRPERAAGLHYLVELTREPVGSPGRVARARPTASIHQGFLDEEGEATIPLAAPGVYRVGLQLNGDGEFMHLGARLDGVQPEWIEVGGDDEVPLVKITVPLAEVDAKMRELEELVERTRERREGR